MMRNCVRTLCCLLVVGATLPGTTAQANPPVSTSLPRSESLDVTPVRDLLHLTRTILEENPGYEATIASLATMDRTARQDSLHMLMQRNSINPRIVNEIEKLLAAPAYRLYYQQFRAANPAAHRKFFFALPYFATDGPGGVGECLLELCRHQREIDEWYNEVISQIDIGRCLAVAYEWLPPGEYSVPKTYFIYDGMGDAFVRNRMVCFDLRGVILSKRHTASRFENLDGIGTDRIERVLAHEFHHIFAQDILFPEGDKDSTWQGRWKDDITRALVSEGLAMQCDPKEGLDKAVRQDSTVIRYWINEVNEKFAALDAESISDLAMSAWWGNSFHAPAEILRSEFLARQFPGRNVDTLAQITAKPDLLHTLGWWMVSHISDGGKYRDEVIRLLSNPEALFSRYNAVIGPGDPRLLIAIDHTR